MIGSETAGSAFQLIKWYFDLVTPDGEVVILYAAQLHWSRIAINYASALVSSAASTAREINRFGRFEQPSQTDGELSWHDRALQITGRWCTRVPAFGSCLLRTQDGAINWRCEAPAADALVKVGERAFVGLGYVERLSLSIPPWKLPFRTLHWGRYASANCSIVWIDWSGEDTRRYVWFDGVEQTDATLAETSISAIAGALTWHDPRDVCHRPALSRLARRIPSTLLRMAGPIATMREHKQIAPGLFSRPPLTDHGWTLFETVTW